MKADEPPAAEDRCAQARPVVAKAEAGQKILRYLEKKLGDVPASLLHRWIRTGQVRRNGHRCKPFDRLEAGDLLRLPPYAQARLLARPEPGTDPTLPLPLIGRWNDVLAIDKPAGLPTHGGSGHADSVAARLRGLFASSSFTPVPAHRLDRATSGVLLAAASFQALRWLHELFACQALQKEYLAWVSGQWPWRESRLLRHRLERQRHGNELMLARPPQSGETGNGAREAVSLVSPLAETGGRSLLLIRLDTGRRHQIRAQLAAEGFPVLGDLKYGGAAGPAGRLYLHSARIILPGAAEFAAPAPWRGNLAAPPLPPAGAVWHSAREGGGSGCPEIGDSADDSRG